jgi:hypothetical protein
LPNLTYRVLPAILGIKTGDSSKAASEEPKTDSSAKKPEAGEEKKEESIVPKKEDKKEEEKKESKTVATEENSAEASTVSEKSEKEEDDDKDAPASPEADKMSIFLLNLENLMNREKVDQAAEDFAYLSTKGNRKKLANVLNPFPFLLRLIKWISAGLVLTEMDLGAVFRQIQSIGYSPLLCAPDCDSEPVLQRHCASGH